MDQPEKMPLESWFSFIVNEEFFLFFYFIEAGLFDRKACVLKEVINGFR